MGFFVPNWYLFNMKKFILTESEKNDILKMYGLINENPISLPTQVTGSYTATNCDELHAFQGTGGKVIGNMNMIVGNKLKEIYDSGIAPKVTNVQVKVQGMNVTWTVTIDKSDDGKAWVGFTSRGAGCNNNVNNRAVSAQVGNDMESVKSKIKSTYNLKEIEIEMVNDFIHNGGENSFRQVFYRYTKPNGSPSVGQSQVKSISIQGNSFGDLRNKLKSETNGVLIDENSVNIDIDTFSVTYNVGQTKIQNMSLIFDDSGQLNNRIPNIKKQNPTLVEIDKGKVGNVEWVLVIIK
jgi:hypothetical protein